MSKRLAQHMCKSAEHYTPLEYVEAAEYVLGAIDLDPASSIFAAYTSPIRAGRYYSMHEDGLVKPWGGRVLVNPPGDPKGTLVRAFWHRASEHALTGGAGAAVLWVGYSIGQLSLLQSKTGRVAGRPCPPPSHWPRIVTRSRIKWETPTLTVGYRANFRLGRRPGMSPTHPSFFCLLGGDGAQKARFRRRFTTYGAYEPGTGTRGHAKRRERQLDREIIFAVTNRGPVSKTTIARAIRARKASVLDMVDQLIDCGRLTVTANGKIAVPAAGEPRPPRLDIEVTGIRSSHGRGTADSHV